MIKISDTEYYSNDKTIRFLNMDCNEFMKKCNPAIFDLAVIDSPYGIGEDGSKNHTRSKIATSKNYKAYQSTDNDSPTIETFNNIIYVSKNQIIWGANHFISKIPYDSSCWLIWDKDNGETDFADCEMAWTSFKTAARKFKHKWQGMLQENMKNKQQRIHPNEKPIELYKWIYDNYTKPNDHILDCFGGSMSNAIACHMKRRKLTIIELDVDYFKSALNRFEIYERQVEDIKEFGYAKSKISAQNPVLF